MNPRWLISSLATLILVQAAAPVMAEKVWPKIGPFWTGMTFDEARAAAPKLAWHDGEIAPYTKKVLSIAANDAVTIGGLSYSIELRPGYLENYRTTYRHSQSVTDAAECQRLTLPVVADLEHTVGSFAAAPRYDTQPVTDTTYHELVQVGSGSTISFETDEDAAKVPRTGDPAWRIGIAQHTAKDTTIQVASMYRRDAQGARDCALTTIVEYAPQAVPTETKPFDPAMLVAQPSIALKHLSLEGVTLATPTVEIGWICDVARQTGALACSLDPSGEIGKDELAAAIMRVRALRLDPGKLDPDNPALLRMRIPLVLARSDRRNIDFLKAPRHKLNEVSWASRPSPEELESVYPQKLLEQGKAAKISLACQIQSDGSLICADANAKPPTDPPVLQDYKAFLWAGKAIMTLYTSAPTLRSGANASGAVVETVVDFKLPK